MKDVEQRIESFYEAYGAVSTKRSVLRLDPDGAFVYLLSPRSEAVCLLADRLDGPGVKRSVTSSVLRQVARWPVVLRAFPNVTHSELVTENSVILVIGSSRQITLLAPESRTAATVGWDGDPRVAEEIETRLSLPPEINVPELHSSDPTFPYFVTEYIDGQQIKNPVEEWKFVASGLQQLRWLYERDGIEWVDMEDAVATLHSDLSDLVYDPVIETGLNRLQGYALPDKLARSTTHGDFHIGNLLVRDESVYLLDWEHTRKNYVFRDFLFPFLHWARNGGRPSIFDEMLLGRKDGKRIGRNYAAELGSLAWNSTEWYPGCVLFGVLDELAQRPRDGTAWDRTYEMFTSLDALDID